MTKEQLSKGLMAFAEHLESLGAENITLGIEPHLQSFVENEANKYGFIDDVSKSFYYKFIYKDAKGELGYTIRKIDKQDNELAIASFEKAFPDLVWRNFGEIEK